MKQTVLILLLLLFIAFNGFSQTESQEVFIKKELGVKQIVWDQENQDGIFKALDKKTNKWGMFQYFEGRSPKKLVSFKYDSLGFYLFNASFTIVKNKGKYGLISDPWGEPKAKLIVKCKHDQLKYVKNGYGMIASKIGNYWSYINQQGDTLIPYASKTFEDLPTPDRQFLEHPMAEYPEQLKKILANPKEVKIINLKGLKLPYIPNEIGLCVNAKTANLENNKLTTLPKSFFQLTQLEKLFLGGNPSLNHFDQNFGELTNLRVLYIGATSGYGSYRSSHTRKTFHEDMKNLQKLNLLLIEGNIITDNDLPAFIYQLPNLKTLKLGGFIGDSFQNVTFDKLSCKNSLESMHISIIDNLSNWNNSMKYFPKLENIRLRVYKTKTAPVGIYNIKNLNYFNVVYYSENEKKTHYNGETIISLDSSGEFELISLKDRKEAIEKWNQFIKK